MLLPNREQIAAALKSVHLFAGLNDRQIAKLSHQAIARRAPANEQIFVEGDECQGLYVIFSGAVKIFKQSAQGREQVLAIEPAGAVVAELPVFDGGPYPASCISVQESVLLFISRQDFRRSCQEDPELALKVLSSVGARLRKLVTIIEELSFLTVRSRLAALLLELAGSSKQPSSAPKQPSSASKIGKSLGVPDPVSKGERNRPGKEPVRLLLNLTQQEIAARIGTVRELVSRNLSRLQAEGVIRLEGHTLVIEDMERLEQEAVSEE
jgi:CRP/FNR family cyclic AMP-dependent transcriptional regulator